MFSVKLPALDTVGATELAFDKHVLNKSIGLSYLRIYCIFQTGGEQLQLHTKM